MKFGFYLLFVTLITVPVIGIARADSGDASLPSLFLLLGPTAENTDAYCSGGQDNDRDSWIDCDDFGCDSTDVCNM